MKSSIKDFFGKCGSFLRIYCPWLLQWPWLWKSFYLVIFLGAVQRKNRWEQLYQMVHFSVSNKLAIRVCKFTSLLLPGKAIRELTVKFSVRTLSIISWNFFQKPDNTVSGSALFYLIHSTEAVTWRCFCQKGVLKNFAKFAENTCPRVSFLIKLQVWGLQLYFIKKETLTQMFSCQFCKIFKNTFFI